MSYSMKGPFGEEASGKGGYLPRTPIRGTTPRTSAEDFEHWKWQIGVESPNGKKLTEPMLRKWANNPDRQVVCIFDETPMPAKYWYCTHCHEYKGIIPLIEGWSD